MSASAEGSIRIWLLPDIYWKTTKGMTQEAVDALMREVEGLAAAQDIEALRQYPFIYIGENCHRRSSMLPEIPTSVA